LLAAADAFSWALGFFWATAIGTPGLKGRTNGSERRWAL
jgi:hypothetical protein